MKAKYILILSVILLLVIIAFMAKDLFYSASPNPENVYEYDLNKTGINIGIENTSREELEETCTLKNIMEKAESISYKEKKGTGFNNQN